jgi:hypothetical protein
VTLTFLQLLSAVLAGALQLLLAFEAYERKDPTWKSAFLVASAFAFFLIANLKLQVLK